jgi:hypothetical protein
MVRVPTAAQLLDAWESGLAQSPIQRALTLLTKACPDATPGELASLPIGERDWRLVQLRRTLFGDEFSIVASCPECDVPLEASFRFDEIWPGAGTPDAGPRTCAAGGYRITFRLPASEDLMRFASHTPGVAARYGLLERCLTEIIDGAGNSVEVASLPVEVVAEVEEQMAIADPQADVQLSLTCPSCGHRWRPVFDIGSFVWHEVNAWAQRTMREVHGLARAYGWREPDVLALSPTRRTIYLELAGQ